VLLTNDADEKNLEHFSRFGWPTTTCAR